MHCKPQSMFYIIRKISGMFSRLSGISQGRPFGLTIVYNNNTALRYYEREPHKFYETSKLEQYPASATTSMN